jgi:hypothetical protein
MGKLNQPLHFLVFFLLLFGAFHSCDDTVKPKDDVIIIQPKMLDPKTEELILSSLNYAEKHKDRLNDTSKLAELSLLKEVYSGSATKRIWSTEHRWLAEGDSLFEFISGAEKYGLFPTSYHLRDLKALRIQLADSASRMNASLWSRAEILSTDAFILLARHLKLGRLGRDSVTLRTDTIFDGKTVRLMIERLTKESSLRQVLEELEPRHPGYLALRNALPQFLDSLDRTNYTYVEFPWKDSILFLHQLQSRLFENSYITYNTREADSLELALAIRKAQMARNLTVDGKAGQQLVTSLNNTGMERLRRIAINLDRFKQLPDSMPDRFIWVNLPEYKLRVMEGDSIVLESKVIVGKPTTRTPVLNSTVTNFVTFPQWTVPSSIIMKEMLPRIQKDISYIRKENLMVVDQNDSVIDPYTVNWSKLNKSNFPYNLRQRQGDDNSLGVMKFNFRNKFDVYLHDTNARSLFSRGARALSHGCVRIQKWDSLSRYLIRSDSTFAIRDSVTAWMKRREKHQVSVTDRLPIFLRYFTTTIVDGRIRLVEDIYGDDKLLRNKVLPSRS